jgi:hypothetical protein
VNPRAALGLFVVVGAGAALFALFQPGVPGGEPARVGGSARCRACHAEVYAEWESSWHARSWTDPEVRRLSSDFANEECLPCHAPRPVFETGLEERVLPRTTSLEEGVDCLACHGSSGADETRVVGTVERLDVACKPRLEADLSRPIFCATCHNQHQTVTEWMMTRYAAQGIGCIECHMPYREGDPARGRDHRMLGGHSLELLQAAVELRAWRENGRVLVQVENVGAGHNFPTDERSRAADVFWRPALSEPGEWRFLYRFRSPYRDEPDVVQSALPPHAKLQIPLDDPKAGDAIEVALFYKLTPYWIERTRPDPEKEALLVERVLLPR